VYWRLNQFIYRKRSDGYVKSTTVWAKSTRRPNTNIKNDNYGASIWVKYSQPKCITTDVFKKNYIFSENNWQQITHSENVGNKSEPNYTSS